MRAKKISIIAAILVVILLLVAACTPQDKEYFNKVSKYSFWDNKADQSIAQYKFRNIVDDFLAEGEIKDGQCIGKDGKVKKVLYVGWDGTRADALTNIFYVSQEVNGYNYEASDYSGLHKLKDEGGLYMAYAGGEKGEDSEQETSTCAGWTSEMTGGWNTLHGVNHNDDVKKADVDTFIMKYAKLGLNTSLAFDWGQLFDLTLKEEIRYWLNNKDLPVVYCDIDRPYASSKADIMKNEGIKNEKDILAESVEMYNAVAIGEENINEKSPYDIGMRDYLMGRIDNGDDIVMGIFHRPDTNGHTYEFSNDCGEYVNSVRNADIYLYQLIEKVKEREAEYNEDWLIVTTADHGGSGQGHGKQIYEHRTIWIACNKELDAYFGKGYDGFNEN